MPEIIGSCPFLYKEESFICNLWCNFISEMDYGTYIIALVWCNNVKIHVMSCSVSLFMVKSRKLAYTKFSERLGGLILEGAYIREGLILENLQ